MTIKKLVVGSMFSMLLGSEMAAANWDDVYYCQMTSFRAITIDGEMKSNKPQKFQFKLDQTKNAMVFGSTGYFKNEVYKLVKGWHWPSQETWYANSTHSMTSFDAGKFLFTHHALYAADVVSADCEKF
jgi:hypothetical protein